jgi:hypothetical protein
MPKEEGGAMEESDSQQVKAIVDAIERIVRRQQWDSKPVLDQVAAQLQEKIQAAGVTADTHSAHTRKNAFRTH